MASKSAEVMAPRLFPSLGPALMTSMAYIDLGKWVAAIESGARFGSDLVLVALFFNFSAILCQYLATCIGMVTEKNLAQICSKEYCKFACILLGIQAEISMITSELTMILGIAHGLSLLLGMDLYTCVLFATIGTFLVPFLVILLDKYKAESLYTSIAGTALVFYVLGVLISQPEIPLTMNVIFPRLGGESTYSLMALLGANVMTHNFYIHSSLVQPQRRLPNVSIGSLFHDHFFSILFIFTGIFLVNYVMMNSAAAVFGTADVSLSFQDVSLLMDQIFRNPIAPVAFFLVLLFSSQITSLTCNFGGQVILQYFFDVKLPIWAHLVLLKTIAVIPALWCASNAGSEGVYQLLIVCQVVSAVLLPSSAIPLFRIASSKLIMGNFKSPWYVEILVLFVFVAMVVSNAIFIIEMVLGSSNWIMNLRGSTGSSVMSPYTFLLLLSFASSALTLYLAVTPVKSASDTADMQITCISSPNDLQEISKNKEVNGEVSDLYKEEYYESHVPEVEYDFGKSVHSHSDKSILEVNTGISDIIVGTDNDFNQYSHELDLTVARKAREYQEDQSKPIAEQVVMSSTDSTDKASSGGMPNLLDMDREVVKDSHVLLTNDKVGVVVSEEPIGEPTAIPSSETPGSSTSCKKDGSDGPTNGGSLSKVCGLGRAARRQLTTILDEFWAHLFDHHGKLTQEASLLKVDVLLGLDSKTVGSSLQADALGAETVKVCSLEVDRGLGFQMRYGDFTSSKQSKIPGVDVSFRNQVGYQPWSQSLQRFDTDMQSAGGNIVDTGEKHCFYQDYQPATIHGYELASYLREIGGNRIGNSLNISVDSSLPKSPSYFPNNRDPVIYGRLQNGLPSLGMPDLPSSTTSRINRLQAERSLYDTPSIESSAFASSAYTKKYHTSPDISSIIAAIRNQSLNDRNAQWNNSPIGPRSSFNRTTYDRPDLVGAAARVAVPSAFDELSLSKIHQDVFPPQPKPSPDAKSLWSKQPFEQLFGMTGEDQTGIDQVGKTSSLTSKEPFSYRESEMKLLQYLRCCILKLWNLEGSDWLFKQNGGMDEELIDLLAAAERYLYDACKVEFQKFGSVNNDLDSIYSRSLPQCGDNCVWRSALVISFGVWCVRRILELSVMESRPELWGKYTYVLNRLQGILEVAFTKPRQPLCPCSCLGLLVSDTKNLKFFQPNCPQSTTEHISKGSMTATSMILELIKDVEVAVSGRKGRTGTAAGDVAFPKGKENLASVLKRYKRRLSNKPPTNEGSSSRKIPIAPASSVL